MESGGDLFVPTSNGALLIMVDPSRSRGKEIVSNRGMAVESSSGVVDIGEDQSDGDEDTKEDVGDETAGETEGEDTKGNEGEGDEETGGEDDGKGEEEDVDVDAEDEGGEGEEEGDVIKNLLT